MYFWVFVYQCALFFVCQSVFVQVHDNVSESVCVCVCVCVFLDKVKAREREILYSL